MFAALALAALLIEAAFGYPSRLFNAIGHPVTWIGRLIDKLDRRWNRPSLSRETRIGFGCILTISLIVTSLAAGVILHRLAGDGLPPLPTVLILGLFASSLLAQRSLHDHVAAVRDSLKDNRSDLDGARLALSKIVGRDTAQLSESEISRAAVESLAENFSDGVVAPAFCLVVGGLPGGLVYKAINTADSMVGHRNKRYEAYGKAVARLDDLLNLPASRLSALLILVAAAFTKGADTRGAWRAIIADARHHTSPNAGWPEAAMGGALGIALAGPRVYDGKTVDAAIMNKKGRRNATAEDIDRALRLYRNADILLIAIVAALTLSLVV
ncbi:adenosylcobinamide-phosphate synthase CbiB [Notoacmeibacter sp. MSK16QG-6]|uniref:adenosylcobinamide-phosphate synthase CbiB n=1 Tax=Notoacmeibacter sp. MSK16QG-6 TaxID=2957982 RepID=UPI00209D60D6|nr:adenosylcobinamide-phosphate synthase CbiB [Notoacmeibacter sp. MSK16QG-6]MCP1199798.1 adenosylcobinamide-phosphate synthase CbiB [Notoacmeibacter sp. MSK16QG-6]